MKKIIALFVSIFLLLISSFFNISVFGMGSNISEKVEHLFNNGAGAFDGYILYTPEFSRYTYLINDSGDVVHSWKSSHIQALPVYLLENGSLVRSCAKNLAPFIRYKTGGFTGLVEMFDWDGNLIWEFSHPDRRYCLHNDIEPLSNGHILMTAWGYMSRTEALKAGINPDKLNRFGGVMLDIIIEVEPIFPKGGNIVWQWSTWDHLIQDYDSSKNNYGVVADHPELINVNANVQRNKLVTPFSRVDSTHINSIDYNEEFDQILLSSHTLNEIFIIDHNTTLKEARGHTGGKYGKGGDLLYRWGNPQNYDRGDKDDQQLFMQHDPQWIKSGYPGEGNITIFDNGVNRPDGNYTSILEIVPPVDSYGKYYIESGCAYGPENPNWSYKANLPSSFYTNIIGGAQRLPSGNTLICNGRYGKFFIVNPECDIVWNYDTPFSQLLICKIFPSLGSVFKVQYYPPDYPGVQNLRL